MPEKVNAKSIVMLIVALVVGLSMTPLIISLINASPTAQTTNQLLNSTFTDNTGQQPDNWDNYVEDAATQAWDNYYVTATSTENNITALDNGVWHQSVTVPSSYDEVSSALANFSYRVIDNDNAISIVVRVYLDNTTDNITLYLENVTALESATWTAIENDISSYITLGGTYTLWIRAEMCGRGLGVSGLGTNLVVGFDDANLTIVTASQSTDPFLYLIPLFYVIALVLGVIVYVTEISKR